MNIFIGKAVQGGLFCITKQQNKKESIYVLENTPVPSRVSVITDYTSGMAIGNRFKILMGHILSGVDPKVFSRAEEARQWISTNRHQPPFLYNIMWPILDHFNSPEELGEEIRRVGWLVWGLEPFVLKGISHILIYGIPGRAEIKASLMKMQFPKDEETKRFSLQVEAELEQHRPLGEPRQPPVTDYIEMGKKGDAVDRLCLLWGNCQDVANRTRIRS